MFLNIRPGVREVATWGKFQVQLLSQNSDYLHFARFRADIGKSVENMGQFICWEILGIIVAAVDRLNWLSLAG